MSRLEPRFVIGFHARADVLRRRVRVDANAFTDRPANNGDVESKFGARTDFVPRIVDVSPRIGFFRAFGTNGTTGIPGFGAPFGNIRGGFGLFRNDVAPTLVAPAMLASGVYGTKVAARMNPISGSSGVVNSPIGTGGSPSVGVSSRS